MLIPTVMLLLGLLVQPICLLYTRAVMSSAAAETARAALTAQSLDDCRKYALRRLDAVPEASLFHVGGREDWQVQVERGSDGKSVTVGLSGHVRPLPLLGVAVSLLGERDQTGVVLRAKVTERLRPDWVSGAYGSWVGVWK